MTVLSSSPLFPQLLNFQSCGGLIVKSHRLSSKLSRCPSLVAGLALFALLLLPTLAGAQTNGLISGTVTDKSGAAEVGAKPVIPNLGGNLTRTTETTGAGVDLPPPLPSGTHHATFTT